jgi:DNA-binding beta-propeller fold protein YncE
MVISSDSATIYAISQSGFLILPVGSIRSNPIANTSTNVVLLGNDQCGATAAIQSSAVGIRNDGQGRLTVSATLQSSTTATATPGLGGAGGPAAALRRFRSSRPSHHHHRRTGGGPAAGGAAVNTATASASAPQLTVVQTDSGPAFKFTYNSKNAASLGTVTPHDFAVQSTEAIDIPPRIRVYQNNRNAEAAGDIIPVPVGVTTTEGLVDMVSDPARRLLYIANSGLNRVEVYDTQAPVSSPIKVGQLPRSLAMSPDGGTLYVANTGGESISVIRLNQLQVTGKLSFRRSPSTPASPYRHRGPSSPRGSELKPSFSDGTNNSLWKSIGTQMTPRGLSP